jgi:hypothetical protein
MIELVACFGCLGGVHLTVFASGLFRFFFVFVRKLGIVNAGTTDA